MTASAELEVIPPRPPIQLTWCITEADKTDVILQRVANSHYHDCPRRRQVGRGKCDDGFCRYFTWYLEHHSHHRSSAEHCQHCAQFETWIEKHSSLYCRRNTCGISLCSEMKKQSVKSKWFKCVEGFDEYLQKSPGSSLTRSGHSLTSSVGEFTRQASTAAGKDDESEHDGYCSDTTSSNPSPTCTQCFVNHHLQDIDSTRPVNSNTRIAAQGLFGRGLSESSVHPNDPAVFNRMQSLERSSVTNNYSQLYSIDKQHRGSSGSVDEDKRESPYHFGAVGFENFPPHVTPQRSSSNSITDTDPLHLQRSPSCSSRERHGLCTQQKQRENDSAFGSTSETDDVSSVESEECTSECTPVATMESASTPTTIHGDSSGLSVQTATSLLDPNETAMDTPCNLEEQFRFTDELLEKYSDDISMLHNRGRPLLVQNPQPPEIVAAHNIADMDHDWRESYTVPSSRRCQTQAKFNVTPPTSFPDDEETISRALDHRASVKEYLEGRFYLQQTYSEHIHWKRIKKIGHGGQAKCYCIEDNVNKYHLCLKEETESKKTLDEAFICLKLARLVRDAPPNIVEFFGASILLYHTGNNCLQLFLELMPGCLQGYVFENGPLSAETTLHYAYQLFEALDYLHQTLKVIHCDIKPANLLIDYNGQRLKVADFGCAELLEEGCPGGKEFRENKDAGTLWYNPPEYYCTGNCSFGMDIWQAGCSVLFMITGRRPWRHLCMDVDKQSPSTTASQAVFMKKRYCELIGEQRERAYPLPGFLRGGVHRGVGQLLQGCLHTASRLSAKDGVYLTAVFEATSPEQKNRMVKEFGYAPPREVLDRLQSPGLAEQQRLVDVYLGQDMFRTEVDGVPHAILNGWLGSVPFQNGMTYGDLLHLVKQQLPVTRHFCDCDLAVCENIPRAIWREDKPYRVHHDQPVDPNRAFLLYPILRTSM